MLLDDTCYSDQLKHDEANQLNVQEYSTLIF